MKRHSGSLLLELMLAILIFALSASVCIQVFVKAHQMSAQAQDLSDGVHHVTNAAEVLRVAPDRDAALGQLKKVYPQLEVSDSEAQAELAGKTLAISWYDDEGVTCYTVSYEGAAGEIYSLEVLGEVQP